MVYKGGNAMLDLNQLKKNYTNWGLAEFAVALGLEARTEYTKELFKKFGQMVRLIGEFDAETLKRLGS